MGEATPAWQFTISSPRSQQNVAPTDRKIIEVLLAVYLLVAAPRQTIDTSLERSQAGELTPQRQQAETLLGARASSIPLPNSERTQRSHDCRSEDASPHVGCLRHADWRPHSGMPANAGMGGGGGGVAGPVPGGNHGAQFPPTRTPESAQADFVPS
jgi:hypothetical protein